jgi:hypothetical protein
MCDTLNTDPAFLQMIKLIPFIYFMVEGKWAVFADGEVSKLRISKQHPTFQQNQNLTYKNFIIHKEVLDVFVNWSIHHATEGHPPITQQYHHVNYEDFERGKILIP